MLAHRRRPLVELRAANAALQALGRYPCQRYSTDTAKEAPKGPLEGFKVEFQFKIQN